MRKTSLLIFLSLLSYNISADSRDMSSGTNPTVGPGPASPGSGMSDTSIMGGGTPGNQGIDTYDVDDPTSKELDVMGMQREEARDEKDENTKNGKGQ